MPSPKLTDLAKGSWEGQSKLHLSWLPEEEQIKECASKLQIELDRNTTFALVQYEWQYEGEVQEGLILVSGNGEGDVSGGWSDSWHQSTGVMSLSGQEDDGVLSLMGSYGAGDDSPDWGWKIELEINSTAQLELRMTNISPDGEEEWAVAGIYRRS